jgi:HAD superfamily hydrolase (TIGR01549 family)
MPLEQPQSIRTIFFDAGFTLISPYPSTPEICQRICQQLGLHIHLDTLTERMKGVDDLFFRMNRIRPQLWASDEAVNSFWIEYYMEYLRPFVEEHDEPRLYELARLINLEYDQHTSWQIYPDVVPTLEALQSRGYKLGIISDWGIGLGRILHKLQLNKYFDSLTVSTLARHAKPSPSLFELALQRADCIADYSLHIGDVYVLDILGARSVGITPILLDRPRHLEPNNVDCLLIHSLSEVLDLLELS